MEIAAAGTNVLITGGASGLGAAITRKFASGSKAKVYFTYFSSSEKAAGIEREFTNAKGLSVDFRNPESLERLIHKIQDFDLDVLVNNALTGMNQKHFHKMKMPDLLNSFEHNVLPTLKITQSAIPGFRAKKSGKIITVLSSYLINRPPTGLSEYVANKAYLHSMSKSWAVENAGFGIASNCISPSFMQTQLTANVDERVIEDMLNAHPQKKLLTPNEVAETIYFLATSSPHLSGVNLIMNGASDVV